MRMVLTHFDYEFGIHGPEGGLGPTTWIFEPLPDDGDGDAEMREAAAAAVDLHRELLDRVFVEALPGKRDRVLGERRGDGRGGDEPVVVLGYQYVGRMTWARRPLLRRRLLHLFGSDAVDARRDSYSGQTRYANIGLIVGGDHGPSDLHLWVTHDLSHAINAALFLRLRALDAFRLDEEAANMVARLGRLLDASDPGGGGDAVPIGLWKPGRGPHVPPSAAEGESVQP